MNNTPWSYKSKNNSEGFNNASKQTERKTVWNKSDFVGGNGNITETETNAWQTKAARNKSIKITALNVQESGKKKEEPQKTEQISCTKKMWEKRKATKKWS